MHVESFSVVCLATCDLTAAEKSLQRKSCTPSASSLRHFSANKSQLMYRRLFDVLTSDIYQCSVVFFDSVNNSDKTLMDFIM